MCYSLTVSSNQTIVGPNGKILAFSNTPCNAVGIMRLPGNVPIQFVIEIVFILIAAFILKRTVFGYQVQAIGENPQAARLCGIRTTQVQIMVYMISAFIAAIAGLLVSVPPCRAARAGS